MKIRFMGLLACLTVFFIGCRDAGLSGSAGRYKDGTYRGVFIDRDRIEVGVEFTLENGMVTQASFRHLGYGQYRLGVDQEPYRSVIQQHQELLDYLVGKNLEQHLDALYRPEHIVSTTADGYTGATIRSGKIISAFRDGLNRGVYRFGN